MFGSRRDAFSRDEVLQENVIVYGTRHNLRHWNKTDAPFVISSCRGVRDIGESDRREIPLSTALDLDSTNKILRLPICEEDDDVLALVDSWPDSLRSFGLDISTGPVVAFRATEFTDK